MRKGYVGSKTLKTGLLAAVVPSLLAGQLLHTPHAAADQRAPSVTLASTGHQQDSNLEDPARELLLALSERSAAEKSQRAKSAPAPKAAAAAPLARSAPPVKKVALAAAPVAKPRAEVSVSANNAADTNQELRAALSRVQTLERELDEARSQLAMAETEVSRLSAIVDTRNRASLGKYSVPVPAPRVARPAPARAIPAARAAVNDVAPPSSHANLKVATISVEKADLRLGPGKNHSALMSIPKGSRLVVEARQGEWYRVFAPNGERAWINAALVTFGDGASSLNDGSSVRVRGFDSNIEEEAFRRVQRITAGQ